MDNEELKEQQLQEEQEEVEQPDNETPQDDEKPEFLLDKDGNLQWNTDEYDNLDKEDSEEEQPNDQDEEKEDETEEEPKYKVKVDGQEIEVTQEELLRGYMRQSDYTRKTQALANERQRYEQQQFINQPINPHPYVNPNEQQQKVEDLNLIAKQIAAHQLGLESPDDLSELDFDHITAVVEAKQALVNQRNAMYYRQQNIDNLEAQLRSEEPKYDEIMQNINTAIQELPVNQFNKIKQAYAEGNPEPLREFFHKMQKEYYANAIQKVEQKKNKSVPKVVPSGNTSPQKSNPRKKIDFRKFGSLTTDQKAQMLLDLGFVD